MHQSATTVFTYVQGSKMFLTRTVRTLCNPTYVPEFAPASKQCVEGFENFLRAADGKVVVLTGAGISTAEWERKGVISSIVTQNVDQLHQKGGSQNVIELHGSGFRVRCLKSGCKTRLTRFQVQNLIRETNPDWIGHSVDIAPDGDVDLAKEQETSFKLPLCPSCKSDLLQPDIVFFGDNVNKTVVNHIYHLIKSSNALLVLGTSLQVFSGYRFIREASTLGRQICIVNIGSTRGDDLASLKISTSCGSLLPYVKL